MLCDYRIMYDEHLEVTDDNSLLIKYSRSSVLIHQTPFCTKFGHSSRAYKMDRPQVFSVPTFAPKPSNPKRICTDSLSRDDFAVLKKNDPFMYFSIPSVRDARLRMKEEEVPSQASDVNSAPNETGTNNNTTFTRKSRISFECHPDLLMEDLLLEMQVMQVDVGAGLARNNSQDISTENLLVLLAHFLNQ